MTLLLSVSGSLSRQTAQYHCQGLYHAPGRDGERRRRKKGGEGLEKKEKAGERDDDGTLLLKDKDLSTGRLVYKCVRDDIYV